MSLRNFLNRTLEIWRPALVPDGRGGRVETLTLTGTVRAKVDQPAADERQEADRYGAKHAHKVYIPPRADVRRGDELRGGGQVFRVLAVVEPSRPIYRKVLAELWQPEGGTGV